MPQSSGSKASNWQAESLRLTVFLATNVQLRDEGWWTKVAGTDPENRIAKPNRGEIVEAGIFQGNVLTLSVQPGRVDWILGPNMSIEDDLGEIKSVGSFRSAETTFSATMSDWLKDCPSTVRLAYGAVLLEPVENREKGYLRVAGHGYGSGSGGFGAVYRATHLAMKRPIAVKVFRPVPGNDSSEGLERFQLEAISLCRINHPNAVAPLNHPVIIAGRPR